MDSIKIEQIVKDRDFDLRLELLAGENGLDRRVVSSRIQKPGLALSGFTEHIHKDRLQVFGNTEISYLARSGMTRRSSASAISSSSRSHAWW